eukprot:GHVH01005322.1.p1 GENE.GHVH01005322.1~~GHVH01005322.1.p1  ORF type:complete len:513 (-),score=62.36 GHVH01005322.1:1270-2808(-)
MTTFYAMRNADCYCQSTVEVAAPFLLLLNTFNSGSLFDPLNEEVVLKLQFELSRGVEEEGRISAEAAQAVSSIQHGVISKSPSGVSYWEGINSPSFVGLCSLGSCYNLYEKFVNRYLRHLLLDESKSAVTIYILCVERWLLWFDPHVAGILMSTGSPLNDRLTGWFHSLFANDLRIDLVLTLWDYYIVEDDITFMIFIALALIITNRNSIIRAHRDDSVFEAVSSISLESCEDVKSIYAIAQLLRSLLPSSLLGEASDPLKARSRISRTGIESQVPHLQRLYSASTPITIDAAEVLVYASMDWKPPKVPSALCNVQLDRWRVLDIDMFSTRRGAGSLLTGKPFDLGMFDVPEGFEELLKMVDCNRGLRRPRPIALMCSDVQVGVRIYSLLLARGVPWVAIVDGGYRAVHDEARLRDVELLEHDEERCQFCTMSSAKISSNSAKYFCEPLPLTFADVGNYDFPWDLLMNITGEPVASQAASVGQSPTRKTKKTKKGVSGLMKTGFKSVKAIYK